MAVKASVTITISKYRDTDSITRYYKLQASTAAAPAVPTTLTPSGWSTSEPTYTSGSTNTLYYTDCIIFSDGTFQYTDDGNGKAVKSSSYEAAKEAYNKAQAAQSSATDITNRVNDKENNYNFKYHLNVTVYGDSNKFYPVIIKYGNQDVKRVLMIKRGYSEKAPAEWNKATHPGGLTLKILTNFGGWGGANYSWEIHEFEEMYSQMFGGAQFCSNCTAFAIFLRGGGENGAIYHIYSDQQLDKTDSSYDYGWDDTLQKYIKSKLPSPQISYRTDYVQYKSDLSFGCPGNKTPDSSGRYDDLQYKVDAPAPRAMATNGTTDGGFTKYVRTSAENDEIRIRRFIKLSQDNDTILKGSVKLITNLYYASDNPTPPSKPTAHVGTNSASSYNQWNIALPTYNESYPYLYTCKETLTNNGTYAWTTVEQTTYAQATKEMQDDIAGIQADYVSNTSFVEYQRTQNATNAGVSEKLLRTEVTLYGDFVYDLLAEEPEDWSTNYKKYYIKSGDNYITVSGSSAPTWQANTYYELITDLTDPNSLVNKMQKVDNDINGENGALDRISDAESTLENTGLNEYNSSIKINQRFLDIEDTVDQMKRVFNITGGVNLIQNSVGYFIGTDNKPTMWSIASETIYSPFGYDADLVGITLSRGKLFCAKGSLVSLDNNIVGLIPNKFLSISFKYKNGANATSKVKIYSGDVVYFEKTFSSAVNQWTEYTYNADTDPAIANPTFACTSNALKIEISSTNNTDNNGFEISDLMLNYGDPKAWELYNSEVFGAIFRLSSLGIELTATTAKTKNFMTTDGILVYEYTPDPTAPSDPNKGTIGNLITKITDDGTLTNKLESTGDIIERNLIHTMITVNNKNIYVEYIR